MHVFIKDLRLCCYNAERIFIQAMWFFRYISHIQSSSYNIQRLYTFVKRKNILGWVIFEMRFVQYRQTSSMLKTSTHEYSTKFDFFIFNIVIYDFRVQRSYCDDDQLYMVCLCRRDIIGLDGIKKINILWKWDYVRAMCWWFGYAVKSDIVLRRMCSSLNGILC